MNHWALTQEVQDRICQALRAGNYRKPAVAWAGVSMSSFCYWMRVGKKEPDSECGRFRKAVLEAETAAELQLVALVMTAAKTDPRHAEWLLSHRHPDRWADQERKRIRAELKLTHRIHEEGGIAALSREEIDRRLHIIDEMDKATSPE